MTELAKFLGTEKEEEFKKAVMEMLLLRVETDLDDYCCNNFFFDYGGYIEETMEEVTETVVKELKTRYEEKLRIKMEEILSKI